MGGFAFFLTMAGALAAMIGLVAFNVFVRGPKVMRSNAAIVEGQQRLIELGERQASALERIASTLEPKA